MLRSRYRLARTILTLLLLLSCVGCDQVTKKLTRTYLAPHSPLSCCGDVVRLHYTENAGAFLGMGWNLSEEIRVLIFQVGVGVGLLALLVALLRSSHYPRSVLVAWTLILSGGIGNVLDRLLHHGRVTDFMNLGIGSLRTGIFNVADVFITIGVLWLLLTLWWEDRPREAMNRSLSLGIVFWFALAAGCDGNRATGPAFQDLIHPNPETALVYFYRPPGPERDHASDWVYAFDRIIRLDDGGYSFQTVPPGRYLIALKSQTDPKADWYDLAGGRAVFLKWQRAGGGAQPVLIQADERRALEELPQCRLMQLDPAGRP